VSIYQD
jgi:hypothetical protein